VNVVDGGGRKLHFVVDGACYSPVTGKRATHGVATALLHKGTVCEQEDHMTKRITTRMSVVTALCAGILGATACSSAPSVLERVGSTEQAIAELTCASRVVPSGTGEGIATASYTVDCSGSSVTSTDGQYGYANCTHGLIWEITALNAGMCGGRVIDTLVTPANNPTDQNNCQGTTMTYYVYGLDTVNGIPYNGPSVSSKACTWDSTFGCDCTSLLTGIDLDNWPDGMGGSLSVDGIRVVGQAYNNYLGAYVRATESVRMSDFSTCCLHRPQHL